MTIRQRYIQIPKQVLLPHLFFRCVTLMLKLVAVYRVLKIYMYNKEQIFSSKPMQKLVNKMKIITNLEIYLDLILVAK